MKLNYPLENINVIFVIYLFTFCLFNQNLKAREVFTHTLKHTGDDTTDFHWAYFEAATATDSV